MRFEVLKNIPKIIIYLGLVLILLAFLVVSGSFNNQGQSNKTSTTKIQGQQSQKLDQATSESTNSGEDTTSTNTIQSTKSTSTKIHVSVSSSTTNNKTTGSTEIEVTTNGKTQNFSEVLDKCITAGKIKISTEDLKIKCESDDGSVEIDWKSDHDESQKNESSFSLEIDKKNKQRN